VKISRFSFMEGRFARGAAFACLALAALLAFFLAWHFAKIAKSHSDADAASSSSVAACELGSECYSIRVHDSLRNLFPDEIEHNINFMARRHIRDFKRIAELDSLGKSDSAMRLEAYSLRAERLSHEDYVLRHRGLRIDRRLEEEKRRKMLDSINAYRKFVEDSLYAERLRDSVGYFVDRCEEFGAWLSVSSNVPSLEFYNSYVSHCLKAGIKPNTDFYKRVDDDFYKKIYR